MVNQPTKREQAQRRAALRPHPARDQVIDILREHDRPLSPTQMARITGRTLGAVAYHVRTLAAAGIVVLADEGRVRGAVEHYYALAIDEHELPRGDRADALLAVCGLTVLPGERGLPQPVVLDDRARVELLELLPRLRATVGRIAAESTQRAAA